MREGDFICGLGLNKKREMFDKVGFLNIFLSERKVRTIKSIVATLFKIETL